MSKQPLTSALADLEAEYAPCSLEAELAASRREIAELRKALQAASDRERSLSSELQHRVRNMLAVIRSIYRRTFEGGTSQGELAEHFEGRLGAIARYHANILGDSGDGIDLETMVRDALLEVQCSDGPQCTIAGPVVRLRHKSAEMMGLALHELTTNAVKFGALNHRGTLAIAWSVSEDAGQSWLRFDWEETGVPLVSAHPREAGFGQDFIEQAMRYELSAKTSFDFAPGRFRCSIALPLATADVPQFYDDPE